MSRPDSAPPRQSSQKRGAQDPRAARAAMQRKRKRKALQILITVVVIILALLAVLYVVYKTSVRPPDLAPMQPIISTDPSASASAGGSTGTTPNQVASDRKGNQWTFVILGFDDGNGNTDTIMVANFDADNHKLSVVNVPRDTLMNVSWYTKKANTLYSSGGGIDGVKNGLSDILGFQIDFYVVVNLKAFEELVDAVGGVDFDVPIDMNYDDPAQDLHIHFKKGLQHLNGKEAMEVVRFRKGYANADIGRISTQQDFLGSAAQQILKKQDQLNLKEIVKIFLNYVKTDVKAGNLAWFGLEFYKMNSSDITFTTLPGNYGDSVNGSSYVTINVTDWLQVLNEKINPFKEDITAKDVSILTRDKNGKLYVTNGVWAGKKTWGGGSSSSSSGGTSPSPSTKPTSSAKPTTSTKPSASPDKNTSPSPSISAEPPSPSPTDTEPSSSPIDDPGAEPSVPDNGGIANPDSGSDFD